MNIYVCTDLEGVAGVVNFDQSGKNGKGAAYEHARRLLTKEVNAVVEACKEFGVEKVLVNDGHGSGFNFIVDELHPEGEYVIGANRIKVFDGLTEEFDGVIFLGYHAMAGTKNAVLDHTQSSSIWLNYWVNDVKMGEIGQHAIMAGVLDIPVILVSGDIATCSEARKLLPGVETVEVKEAYSRTCAKIIPPAKALQMIKVGVTKALENLKSDDRYCPYKIDFPAKVQIEFQTSDYACAYERSGWRRLSGTKVEKTIAAPADPTRLIMW